MLARERGCLLVAAIALLASTVLMLWLAAPATAILGCGIDPGCIVGKAVGGGISSVAGDAITALAKAVLGALGHTIEWASTLWVGVGTPSVADTAGTNRRKSRKQQPKRPMVPAKREKSTQVGAYMRQLEGRKRIGQKQPRHLDGGDSAQVALEYSRRDGFEVRRATQHANPAVKEF